jgi:hypothetical protein
MAEKKGETGRTEQNCVIIKERKAKLCHTLKVENIVEDTCRRDRKLIGRTYQSMLPC